MTLYRNVTKKPLHGMPDTSVIAPGVVIDLTEDHMVQQLADHVTAGRLVPVDAPKK